MSEASENEEDFTSDEAADEKPLCYHVMNSGVVEEQKVIFEETKPKNDVPTMKKNQQYTRSHLGRVGYWYNHQI